VHGGSVTVRERQRGMKILGLNLAWILFGWG
jgi:hypothetical protein